MDAHFFTLDIAMLAGAFSLMGVLVGGLVTNHNQKMERRDKRIREQLAFYRTMLGMFREVEAKQEYQREIKRTFSMGYVVLKSYIVMDQKPGVRCGGGTKVTVYLFSAIRGWPSLSNWGAV